MLSNVTLYFIWVVIKNLAAMILKTKDINATSIEKKIDFIPINQSPDVKKYLKPSSVKVLGKISVAFQLLKKAQTIIDIIGSTKNISIENMNTLLIHLLTPLPPLVHYPLSFYNKANIILKIL